MALKSAPQSAPKAMKVKRGDLYTAEQSCDGGRRREETCIKYKFSLDLENPGVPVGWI